MTRKKVCIALGSFVIVVSAPGCQKSSARHDSPVESGDAVPAASAVGTLDVQVSKALAEVAQAEAAPELTDGSGPPATGVFTLAQADKEQAPGSPSTLTLASSGSEPRLTFGTDRAGVLRGSLDVLATTGPSSALPRLDVTLERKLQAPTSGAGGAAGSDVTSRVTFVKVAAAADQPGELPAALAAHIATLSGSWLSESRAPSGGLTSGDDGLPPAADQRLKPLFQRALEAYRHFDLQLPSDPVGQGAVWLVRSRELFGDTPVITYRMYRVKSVDAGQAILEVNIRRYAAGPTTQIADIPDHQLAQYSAEGSGELTVLPGATWPVQGSVSERVQMLIATQDDARPRVLQSELTAKFKRATP